MLYLFRTVIQTAEIRVFPFNVFIIIEQVVPEILSSFINQSFLCVRLFSSFFASPSHYWICQFFFFSFFFIFILLSYIPIQISNFMYIIIIINCSYRITGNLLNCCIPPIMQYIIGCGFIGRHLVSNLISNGLVSHIRVVDKTPPLLAWLNNQHMAAFNDKAVEFCSANLINQGQWRIIGNV